MEPANIQPISETSDISKFDKSKEVKEINSRKKLPASFNLTGPKSFIFIEVNALQPINIIFPLIIFEKSNSEKSISVILLQPLNRHPQFSLASYHTNLIVLSVLSKSYLVEIIICFSLFI